MRRAEALPVVLLAALFAAHFAVVARHAVDVPYWDDWESLRPGALAAVPSLDWLFAWHVESLHVPTKLQFWAGYRLDGLDFARQQLVTFGVFGAAVAAAAALAARCGLPLWAACAFLPFALSPRSHEALSWAHASPHDFALTGFFCAAVLLFAEPLGRGRALLGAAAALFSVVSHVSGFLACAALWAVFCLRWALGPRRDDAAARAAAAGLLAAGLAAWMLGFRPEPAHPPGVPPWDARFWAFFLDLAASGFGVDGPARAVGALVALGTIVPVAARRLRESADAALAAGVLGLLAVLAGTAVGRAGFGAAYAGVSRYAALGAFLIPLAAAGWNRLLAGRRGQAPALAALWAAAALGYAGDWDFGVYRVLEQERRLGLECVRAYYRGGGPPFCPMVYPHPLGERLERARALGVSFTRGR